jgi:hypothetical protein
MARFGSTEGGDAMDPEETLERLVGNKAIETAAVLWVMELERAAGREPVDRRFEASFSADIESPPRLIDVKAVGGNQRGWFVPLEVPQVEEGSPEPKLPSVRRRQRRAGQLRGIPAQGLWRSTACPAAHAGERSYFEMPIPVAEFDSAPGRDAL